MEPPSRVRNGTAPRRRLVPMLLAVGVASALIACGGARTTVPTATGGPLGVGPLPTAEPPSLGQVGSDGSRPVAPTDTVDIPIVDTALVDSSIVPVFTDDGVPGLDDAEVLCAAWARFEGSTQILAIAASFGQLAPVQLARLEVVAAPVLRAAADDVARLLPASIADEQAVFVDDVVGPFRRRSARAEAFLADAGARRDQLLVIAEAWLAALRDRDADQPVPSVAPFDPVVQAMIDAAAVQFQVEIAAFGADSSLDTSAAATPRTDALLAERCPDPTL